MRALVAVLGAALVLVAWLSILRTVLVPRDRSSRTSRWTTGLVAGAALVAARRLRGSPREGLLSFCVPVILVVMASIWLVAATAGFALLAWGAAGVPFGAHAMADFFLLRSAGVPIGAIDWLSTGLLLGVFTARLVRLTDAYSRRERLVIRLTAQATRPLDAETVLSGYLRARTPGHLGVTFARWADWLADVEGTHLGYPELVYYRAAGELSWTGAALIVLDCAALTQACAPGWAPPQALSLLTVGSRCLQLIAARLKIALPPVPVSFQGRETRSFHGTIKKMRLAGLPLERDEDSAQAVFQQLRVQYAPFASAIDERLLYESADVGEVHELHGSSTGSIMACPITEPYDIVFDSAAEAATHCRYLLSSLPRADQRRWAEIFVRGLLTVRGRKTIRKISDQVAGGGAEQCLQQFVNQSTWRWDTVRRDLALRLTGALKPRAWVIRDVVMPKNGSHSVGVDRQFAHPEGRVLNCQLGMAVFLAGDDWSCPVNWRLPLPPSWDHDKERRKKAHVPDEERSCPRWQHVLDAIDEMAVDWGLPPLPVLADMSQEPELDSLLRGLDERHLRYALRVGVNRPAVMVGSAASAPRTLSFAQVIAESIDRNTTALNRWHLPAGRPGRPQLIAARLPADAMAISLRPPRARCPQPPPAPGWTPLRHVVAEWSPVRKAPRTAWLTSFDPHRLPTLPEEIKRHDRTGADLSQLYDELGLQHFEGRSYPGWHHYVTLVSIASACQQLSRPACQPRW